MTERALFTLSPLTSPRGPSSLTTPARIRDSSRHLRRQRRRARRYRLTIAPWEPLGPRPRKASWLAHRLRRRCQRSAYFTFVTNK
ncbi:hypothetical protein EVAR_96272_1 [Eumeta japonica]|uniref:Uncharacterized protein n=1 Tax=Eumeta variegata TaxID=151549 RepID=A0A4C1WKE9_EUMVA|nr:hypothetical protein EVAR_96272_1 [Eumeta japonica]